MSEVKTILVIANSGRMLAQLARKSGYIPVVIDCFSDLDTQSLALECVAVEQLSLDNVEKGFFFLQNRYSISHVIYGSGLEKQTGTLAFLQQHSIVLGNTLESFLLIQNKESFFARMNGLNIPFPNIVFNPPVSKNDWLIKPMQGEGGIGIKKYLKQSEDLDSYYWQKYQTGVSMSVLFIATETDYRIIGFNKQLITKIGEYEFIFAGVISQPAISVRINDTVNDWLKKLVAELSLKGLNSLDFIVSQNQLYFLEINARPSASMQIYNNDLFSQHINSCLFNKLEEQTESKTYRAYKVIFAKNDLILNKATAWPSWILDVPQLDSIIHTGMPICSIIASGKNEQQVLDLLQLRQQVVRKLLQ